MPGENLLSWSVTAADNANSDTSINWAEGQPRASVNNSARSQMAAHAKNRNLQNGSIVTGGSANAQTFTSGVGYTSAPGGLRVLLNMGFTNTGAMTLEVDGLGALPVVSAIGTPLVGGEVSVNSFSEFLCEGTQWVLLHDQGSVGVNTWGVAQHGRLILLSPTLIWLRPFDGGNTVKIFGELYHAVGLTAATTNVRVNGVAGQSLAANTTYMVFLTAAYGGAPNDVDFRQIPNAGWTHAASTTANNEGVEVLYDGTTLYDQWSLIGMVRTNGSAQFQSDLSFRGVISWFNRRNLPLRGASTAGATTNQGAGTELTAAARIEFVTWGEEGDFVTISGEVSNDTAFAFSYFIMGLDGTAALGAFVPQAQALVAGAKTAIAASDASNIADGYHFITPVGAVTAGTATYSVWVNAMIRG